jgi:hypothetical protein
MDSKMVEDVTKALERFSGLEIKVRIEVFTGRKPKADPPNTHPSKNAPVGASNFNGEEDR